MEKKSFENIVNAVEASKQNSLEKLLFGLGIPGVGSKTAKLLASQFENIDNLMQASKEELKSIKDIGSILATSIYEYFQNNQDLIYKLKMLDLNMKYLGVKKKINEFITGKKFVMTGSISFMSRDDIKALIEEYDGTFSESVSKKTVQLLINEGQLHKRLAIDMCNRENHCRLNYTQWNRKEYILLEPSKFPVSKLIKLTLSVV